MSDLLDLTSAPPPADPGAALRHVLTAPMWVDAGDLAPALLARLRAAPGPAGLVLKSLADVFRHPHPGVELLGVVKEYAKECRHDPDGPLPPAVATVVYYAAIAAALVRHGVVITEHEPDVLRDGFAWVAARPWVDADTKALIESALARPGG